MNIFSKLGTSLSHAWGRREGGISITNIRPANLIYVLAYVFELLFFSFYSAFLYTDIKLFGIGSAMPMYAAHMVMSLVIMLLWTTKFKHLIYISVAVTALSFTAFMVVPDEMTKFICSVFVMAGVGGCVTCARCGFSFAANNSERLFAVVMALGGRALLQFTDAIFPDGLFWDNFLFYKAFPILFLGGMVFCLLRFRENDLEVKEETTKTDKSGLYWAFALFIVYFAINGYSGLMFDGDYTAATLSDAIGKIIAIAIFLFVLIWLKKSIWHILNLYFGVLIVAAVLSNFALTPLTNISGNVLLGISEIGWIAVLYILGCAQRRFASYKLLKKCTIAFVILSPLTTLSDELVSGMLPQFLPIITVVYIITIAIVFFVTTPASYKYLFSAVWLDDLYKPDMELVREKVEETSRFAKYNLSPREKEVAVLLLSAYTLRMIAGDLKLAESTVSMHRNKLYRKLNINSKAELFQKFGVPLEPDKQ